MFVRVITLFTTAFLLSGFLYIVTLQDLAFPSIVLGNSASVIQAGSAQSYGSILFTGDVMLARDVEEYMEIYGELYPFAGMADIFTKDRFVVGNFEGSVPVKHTKTKHLEMAFSVRESYMRILNQVDFSAFSLSNNHAFDYGADAYTYTKNVCTDADISCFGHPLETTEDSVLYVEQDGFKIGILALHTLHGSLDEVRVSALLSAMSEKSDVQVAYIHWGNEYEQLHSEAQQILAYRLVDNGADAVIGHHPHVVQDIEVYKGVPIFYSLGNFIFDQYFDDAVQVGLVVDMKVSDDRIEYELVPVTSIDSRNQPHQMNALDTRAFLQALSERHKSGYSFMVQKGQIVLLR